MESYLKKENLLNLLVDRALVQASRSHQHQRRDNGKSYLKEHIFPVTKEVVSFYRKFNRELSDQIVSAALLHDALEDDRDLSEAVFKKKFGPQVFEIVEPLTKPPNDHNDKISEKEKMAINRKRVDIIVGSSYASRVVKTIDRINNVLCTPFIKNSRPDKYKRYKKETKLYFLPLARKTSPYLYRKLKKAWEEL